VSACQKVIHPPLSRDPLRRLRRTMLGSVKGLVSRVRSAAYALDPSSAWFTTRPDRWIPRERRVDQFSSGGSSAGRRGRGGRAVVLASNVNPAALGVAGDSGFQRARTRFWVPPG